jgi:hypothetical protein
MRCPIALGQKKGSFSILMVKENSKCMVGLVEVLTWVWHMQNQNV